MHKYFDHARSYAEHEFMTTPLERVARGIARVAQHLLIRQLDERDRQAAR